MASHGVGPAGTAVFAKSSAARYFEVARADVL